MKQYILLLSLLSIFLIGCGKKPYGKFEVIREGSQGGVYAQVEFNKEGYLSYKLEVFESEGENVSYELMEESAGQGVLKGSDIIDVRKQKTVFRYNSTADVMWYVGPDVLLKRVEEFTQKPYGVKK